MNKRNLLIGTLALGCLTLGSFSKANAQATAFTFPVSSGLDTTFGSIGMEFTVVSPITVTALGAYDNLQDGFATNNIVQIYSLSSLTATSGTALGSSITLNGFNGILAGNSRFIPIAPLVLNPGTYLINMTSNGELYRNDPSGAGVVPYATVPANVNPLNFTGAVSRFGTGAFANSRNLNFDKAGPTFQFTPPIAPAPEPGTMALLSMGVVAIVAKRRKK